MGSTVVAFDNPELEGKHGAAMNAGSAYVTIKRSTLRGALAIEGSSTVRLVNTTVHGARNVTSSATYIDGAAQVSQAMTAAPHHRR
jgi:hypothetical protein